MKKAYGNCFTPPHNLANDDDNARLRLGIPCVLVSRWNHVTYLVTSRSLSVNPLHSKNTFRRSELSLGEARGKESKKMPLERNDKNWAVWIWMIMQILCKFGINETRGSSAGASGKWAGSGSYWTRAEHGKACPGLSIKATEKKRRSARNTRVELKFACAILAVVYRRKSTKLESFLFFPESFSPLTI